MGTVNPMLMEQTGLLEEAQNCRRKAIDYIGQPEASFLLQVAKAFEDLDSAERLAQPRRGRA